MANISDVIENFLTELFGDETSQPKGLFVDDVVEAVPMDEPAVEEVPAEELEQEKEILRNQALNEGKPAQIVEKMVEGRVKKFYQDVCLLEQPFVKDSSMTIQAYINEMTLKIGEKISVRRFTRYEMGEGLEKRHDNLAEEVEKQMQKKN